MRRMNNALQGFNIGRMLSSYSRFDTTQFDITAHLDRKLTYGENAANIRRLAGVGTTRNRALEQHNQLIRERQIEHARRQDALRQTGRIQNARNRELDRKREAQRPGKRFSEGGHRYYERRENRTDKNPSTGL
jgi:hypothetical protein